MLAAIDAYLSRRRARSADSGSGTAVQGGLYMALLVAIGIGLHNLGEGLAIGSAYATGALALGAFLVVGFAIHNTTEGLAIVAPLREGAGPSAGPRFGHLAALGLIAGAPAVLGAWIGAAAFNPSLAALLFGVGVGAIARVIVQIAPAMRDGEGRLLHPLSVAGHARRHRPSLRHRPAGLGLMAAAGESPRRAPGTEAIEDYAKAIYALSRKRPGPVTNGELAERLGVTPATATSMLKRLADLGLVDYLPYKGVTLTPAGEKVALEVIRHHRLIEAYLSEALGMPEDRVHEEAEVLEHYISEDLELLIAAKLGEPSHDPHGTPIPGPDLLPPAD